MSVADHAEQDEGVRRLINEALDQTLFVEAGAGTGKTRALVDRFVSLVKARREVDRILAITFTEKAAAELRDRVRSALEEDGSEAATEALAALDRAQISTIHSFAQAMLKTFSAQAGVDPDFEVQDEVSAERRLQDRWRAYLVELGDDASAVAVIDRALSLGMQTYEIERLATELTARAALAEILESNPLAAGEPDWPDLASMIERLNAVIADAPEDCYLTHRLHGVRTGIEEVAQARPEDREAALVASAPKFYGKAGGNASKWRGGKAQRDAALDVCMEFSDAVKGLVAGLRSAALTKLMPYVVAFVRREETARAREGALTFDDLILRVRDVLRDDEGVRRAFRERYDALLIDEFQDTDPLQMEIALAFARDPDSGALEPGRLFLVGDPKQSIYRFRRADMEMYSRTRERLEREGAATPELAHNQRSRPQILAWINAVFGPLIGGGDNPEVQPPYRDIHPRRIAELRGPGVSWMQAADDLSARDMRTNEAQAIAMQCRRAVSEGWQVQDREGEVREATFADIAILIPRRILLSPLERQLADARIPYRVEGGSLVYRTQEVRDIINCLTAVDDPADEVAIVGALRSPAFACSDVDLARFVAAGARFNYFRPDLEARDGPVAEGLRVLHAYHLERHDRSLAGLVERIVWERGIVEAGTLAQQDRNAFRRARFMIEQARKFETAKPESVRAFVAWLERQAGGTIVDHEGTGIDDDEDAVRIMTVHGAKGLEFPIVILAGLAAAPNPGNYPVYLADYGEGRVGVQIGSIGANRVFSAGAYAELRAKEQAHETAEMDRLAYVAATRARDHLLVSFSYNSRIRGCIGERLTDHGARGMAPELSVPATLEVRGVVQPLSGLSLELPEAGGFSERRQALVDRSVQRRFTSATGLKREADAGFEEREREDESEPWARGRAGTRVGRAVHAAIQGLPLEPDDEMIVAFSRAQAVAEGVPHRERDVERLVRWVVRESRAWQRAMASRRAMRETPFAVALDGRIVEGFIDLLIEDEHGIEIVDWKTDQVPRSEVEERLRAYRLQAGLYVHGIETATRRRISRVTYVFADAKVEVSPGEPRALAEEALAGLATLSPG